MSGADTVLPNFATVATLSCFEPYRKPVCALAVQPAFRHVLQLSKWSLKSRLDELKRDVYARDNQCVSGAALAGHEALYLRVSIHQCRLCKGHRK